MVREYGIVHKDFRNVRQFDGMNLLPGDCPDEGDLGVMYVCRGYVVPKNTYVIDVVRFADQVPAYVLVQYLQEGDVRLLEDKGFRIVTK